MRFSIQKLFVKLFAFAALIGFGGTGALAIPASMNPNGPSVVTLVEVNLGSSEIAASVSHDPNAGPWEKQIIVTDESFGTGAGMIPGDIITLTETITIAPGVRTWTDWHEIIQTDFFFWGDVSIDIVSGGVANPLNHTMIKDAGELSLFFDPLPDGTELVITKQILMDINAPFPDPFTGAIVIHEYPTVAEPETMLLFGAGFAALLLYRRRGHFLSKRV